MGIVADVDVFFIQLINAVEKWYDLNYMDISSMKGIHLDTVMINYRPERFRKSTNLNTERVNFLAEMHNLVWETTTLGY